MHLVVVVAVVVRRVMLIRITEMDVRRRRRGVNLPTTVSTCASCGCCWRWWTTGILELVSRCFHQWMPGLVQVKQSAAFGFVVAVNLLTTRLRLLHQHEKLLPRFRVVTNWVVVMVVVGLLLVGMMMMMATIRNRPTRLEFVVLKGRRSPMMRMRYAMYFRRGQ